MKKTQVTISIDIELYQELTKLREKQKLKTLSGEINKLLWDWVEEKKNE